MALSAGLTAVLVCGIAVVGDPSYAGAPPAHSTLDPNTVKASIDYLTSTYKVSQAEALRRLELQNDAQKLDAALTRQHPAEYGGMWLDQDHGGVLTLAMTKPAVATSYVSGMADRKNVRTVRVAHSLASLNAARDRLAKKVGEGPDAIYLPAVDMTGNRVVLWKRDWVAQGKLAGTWDVDSMRTKAWETTLAGRKPAMPEATRTTPSSPAARRQQVLAETATATSAVAPETGLVVQRTLPKPEPLYTPFVDWGYCHPLYCQPYYGGMRGGLRLDIKRDDGSWGGCTSGFNVRSSGSIWNGWGWIVTAGHCVAGKTNQTHTQHNGYDVFLQHGVERNSYPYDYTVVPYIDGNRSTSWLENQYNHNLVMTYCRNGGQDSDSDTPCGAQATSNNTPIRGYHSLGEIRGGWIVCASGSASHTDNYPASWTSGPNSGYLVGTRCGKVKSTDVGINTDICARAGDSGGPLFSQLDFTAYGILEGNQQHRSGPCQPGELNNYSPISTILYDINYGYQNLLFNYNTSMNIIMSSNG
jgi:streptogrisin C